MPMYETAIKPALLNYSKCQRRFDARKKTSTTYISFIYVVLQLNQLNLEQLINYKAGP